MAILTVDQFVQQIIAQARALDPSMSIEVGTPERKIVDAFAQLLADNQVDLTGLASALDIDGKFGSNLDQFTAMFGMQRQQAAATTGFVVFSRTAPAPAQISIPSGTVVQAQQGANSNQTTPMQYATTASGIVNLGGTQSGYVPVQAISTGTIGNAAANTVNVMVGSPPPGVTAVTNPAPFTNGNDAESDDNFKVRFKNTWARNLAGTQDQLLAIAVSSAFTTKANVIGVESRYQEYIQIPDFDDAGYAFGTQTAPQNTAGLQGRWTTAVSDIPFAKDIYTTTPSFVSNGQLGSINFYYRSGIDFIFNYPALDSGDALREVAATSASTQTNVGAGPINVDSTIGFPGSGFLMAGQATPVALGYTGITSTSFTGVYLLSSPSSSYTVQSGASLFLISSPDTPAPNFSFYNVFNPSSPTTIEGLQALTPGEVVLSEFSYLSQASRNDISKHVNNAVDVYVDGQNVTQASCVFLSDLLPNQQFNLNPNSPYYYENFRRDGEPAKRPQWNNYITPLFQSPLVSLPPSLVINHETYYLGAHYWLVHEIGPLGGSIRARDAIEWNNQIGADNSNVGKPDLQLDPVTNAVIGPQLAPYTYGGDPFPALPAHTAVEVDNYSFDANVVTIQASMESTSSRQVTTDLLVHGATLRYFKLDITVMYSNNTNFAVVNSSIATALQAFFNRQYFGSVIQLSTLLEIIHEVNGVENVRWSNDLPHVPNEIRVFETDIYGTPLHGASIDRLIIGGGSVTETQTLYIVGNPVGTFTLTWTDPGLNSGNPVTTTAMAFQTNGQLIADSTIQSAVRTALNAIVGSGIYHNVSVNQDTRPTVGVANPITSYTITYGANGTPYLPTVTETITSSDYDYDEDYFLLDNELPSLPSFSITGDTLPGLIIRPRAQSTFYRPGVG